LELEDLTGEMRLNTVSGKILGHRLNGKLTLDTVSGRVELQESNLASAEAHTVSGGMEFQTALSEGPYRFNSVSGNVELLVPAETRCSAELHAVSGSISTKLPATSVSRRNGSQTIEVQGGGVKVYANSVSGNLSLAS
jgi:lia operon protein LiaG